MLPNILLICSDTHRADWSGFAGADWVDTPNLDALAARGTTFDRCYAVCPTCIPARTALASGMLPTRYGMLHNHEGNLPWPSPTLYRHLRTHGYWTSLSGKLHVRVDAFGTGNSPSGVYPGLFELGFCDGLQCGQTFDKDWDHPGNPYPQYLADKGLFEQYREDRNRRRAARDAGDGFGYHADFPFPFEDRTDTFVTRRFVDWLQAYPGDYPFFHQLNLIAPHSPYEPSAEYAAKYRDRPMPAANLAMDGKPRWIRDQAQSESPEEIAHNRRQYSAMVEELDTAVGMAIQALKDQGVYDETIVIYTSDHGDMLGDFGRYQKHTAYDPSVRVPLIIAGPGLPEGRRSDALVEWSDLNPTLVELAGCPAQHGLDARSFAGVIRGEAAEHRASAMSIHPNWRSVTTARYRYTENLNDQAELYDLQEDPEERVNLAAGASVDAKQLRQMRGLLNQRLQYRG